MAKPLYVYTGSQWVPVASELESTSQYLPADQAQAPFRNLIINGAMQVAQRNTSVTGIQTSNYWTVDRYETIITANSFGTWTQSVENDAPTGSGFRKSLKMLCTTADSSPAAADILFIRQHIEGQNLQAIKKGTANAEQLTISFWVKSNVTGTYILSLLDGDNTRQISATYTISTSATWEKKTITFPADTTGAFDNDNGSSLRVDFWLGTGSDYGGGTLNTSWNSNVNANRAVGQTNLASATNNYWQITGVQLEIGAVATPFEFKPYAQELAECQRYYIRLNGETGGAGYGLGFAYSTSGAQTSVPLPTTMRIYPTSIEYSNIRLTDNVAGFAISALSLSTDKGNTSNMNILATGASGLTQYRGYILGGNGSTPNYIGLSAEL